MNRIEEYLAHHEKETPETVVNLLKTIKEPFTMSYGTTIESGLTFEPDRTIIAELDIKTPDADFLIHCKLKR